MSLSLWGWLFCPKTSPGYTTDFLFFNGGHQSNHGWIRTSCHSILPSCLYCNNSTSSDSLSSTSDVGQIHTTRLRPRKTPLRPKNHRKNSERRRKASSLTATRQCCMLLLMEEARRYVEGMIMVLKATLAKGHASRFSEWNEWETAGCRASYSSIWLWFPVGLCVSRE